MAFQTGRTGKLFTEFALTLAGAVLVSGFTALTLSPKMCARLLRHETRHGAMYQRIEGWLAALDRGYRNALKHVRGWRWAMLGGTPAMTAAMLVCFTKLPPALAPVEAQGMLIGTACGPEGATTDNTHG